MNGKRILVTGGVGYVGSHTVIELMGAGCEVVVIDNLSTSSETSLDGIGRITGRKPEFHKFDLCNRKRLGEFFADSRNIAGVVHFAAHKSVGESVRQPLKYYRNNILSLANVLLQMQEYDIGPLVFSSSCTVYGQPDKLPVKESSPRREATSPYGNTKRICEDILRDAAAAGNVRAISLRYFNPIGAHPSALIGEMPAGKPENLVPYITQTAIGRRDVIRVFGNDYNTPDGTCIRDYIHVVDIARAHVRALDRLLTGKGKGAYEVFNLGTGKGNTVLEVIAAFEKVSGVKLNYEIAARRPGDIEATFADTSLANAELGWKAEKSLEEMIGSAWEWEKRLNETI